MKDFIVWIIENKDKFEKIAVNVLSKNPSLNKPENRTAMFFEIQNREGCECLGRTQQDAELLAANLRESGLRAKVIKLQ